MTQSILSVRMDNDTKAAFADFCDQVGMSISTAVNIFVRQTVRERRLPFDISLIKTDSADQVLDGILTLGKIKNAVAVAAKEIPAIQKIVLFGSYARGEARPESDIDLRVLYDDSAMSLLDLGGFIEDIHEATGKPIDIVSKSDLGDGGIAESIAREGVVLYER